MEAYLDEPRTLRVKSKSQKITTVEKCGCENTCGDHCPNRLLNVQCNSENCATPGCTNRQFPIKGYAKRHQFFKLKHSVEKGTGAFASMKLAKNTFMGEYVGKEISLQEARIRIKENAKKNFQDGLYMAQIDARRCLDAVDIVWDKIGTKFFNHSCQPNCNLERWFVGNQTRLGIFTNREIEKNEELSLDYGFNIGLKCRCGASKCTGILNAKKSRKLQRKFSRMNRNKNNNNNSNNNNSNFNNNNIYNNNNNLDNIFNNNIYNNNERRRKKTKYLSKNEIQHAHGYLLPPPYVPTFLLRNRSKIISWHLTKKKQPEIIPPENLILCNKIRKIEK